MITPAEPPARTPFAGVRMILRYNWPLYVAGLATASGGATLAARPAAPGPLRAGGAAAGAVAGWLSVASLVASWWIYDRSELYRWDWLRQAARAPRRVLVVHAGLDEASAPVRATWPDAEVSALDVHGGLGRTTAPLRLARRHQPGAATAGQLAPANDLVVAFLAAHELRSPDDRVQLLRTLHDHLAVGGRLVLVEHVRDVTNALAFGPAIGHFYPVAEWRRVIQRGGLQLVAERRITPFVVVLTAERVEEPTG